MPYHSQIFATKPDPTHNTYHLILRDPTSISSHTLPPIEIHTASFSCPNRRRSSHIHPPPLTIHTVSFSCPNRRQSPHIHSAFPLLTLCVGVEFTVLFVIFRQCYLWRETSVKRALCVQYQPTLSVICDVIFLRDSGNQRCEILVVILCRDHLIQNTFTLSSYYHSWEITTCIVVSHSYEITAGIVALFSLGILLGNIPPPYKILFLDSRPRQNQVRIVGIVDP